MKRRKLYQIDIESEDKPIFNDYYGSAVDAIQRAVCIPKGDSLLIRDTYRPIFDSPINLACQENPNMLTIIKEYEQKEVR